MSEIKENPIGYRANNGKYCSGDKACFRCGQYPCNCGSMGNLNQPKAADGKAQKADNGLTSNQKLLKLRMEAKVAGIKGFNSMDAGQLKSALGKVEIVSSPTVEPTPVPQDTPAGFDKKAALGKLKEAGVKVHHLTGEEKVKDLCKANGIGL